MVAGAPRIAAVTARTAVIAAYVPRHAFDALLTAQPDGWRPIAGLSNELLAIALPAVADSMIRDSRRRCAAVLLRLGDRRLGGEAPVELPLAQEDIATLATLTRKTAGLVLRGLERDGLIALGYRSITLRAPAALRRVVEGG
jgi:CRP-like cAMP-binding protein